MTLERYCELFNEAQHNVREAKRAVLAQAPFASQRAQQALRKLRWVQDRDPRVDRAARLPRMSLQHQGRLRRQPQDTPLHELPA
jgi:hypothetical protein